MEFTIPAICICSVIEYSSKMIYYVTPSILLLEGLRFYYFFISCQNAWGFGRGAERRLSLFCLWPSSCLSWVSCSPFFLQFTRLYFWPFFSSWMNAGLYELYTFVPRMHHQTRPLYCLLGKAHVWLFLSLQLPFPLSVVLNVSTEWFKGATPGPRKQTSAGQGLINISVTTETGESWEGRCAGVSRSAKSPETVWPTARPKKWENAV